MPPPASLLDVVDDHGHAAVFHEPAVKGRHRPLDGSESLHDSQPDHLPGLIVALD